jgi:hypothetical protein
MPEKIPHCTETGYILAFKGRKNIYLPLIQLFCTKSHNIWLMNFRIVSVLSLKTIEMSGYNNRKQICLQAKEGCQGLHCELLRQFISATSLVVKKAYPTGVGLTTSSFPLLSSLVLQCPAVTSRNLMVSVKTPLY